MRRLCASAKQAKVKDQHLQIARSPPAQALGHISAQTSKIPNGDGEASLVPIGNNLLDGPDLDLRDWGLWQFRGGKKCIWDLNGFTHMT